MGRAWCRRRELNPPERPPSLAPRPRAHTKRALFDVLVDVALAHGFTAEGAGEMHGVALGRRDEAANLLEPFGRQPALPSPPLHRETIRCLLVGSAELVPALVRIDP